MTVRFIALAHGVRDVKDHMSREIIAAMDDAGIAIASSTYDIVGFHRCTSSESSRNRGTNRTTCSYLPQLRSLVGATSAAQLIAIHEKRRRPSE